jgi:hypothetical protein
VATEIHKTWNEVRSQILDMVEELQTWRDYEEEVGYDTESVDRLTDAIDSLLAIIANGGK